MIKKQKHIFKKNVFETTPEKTVWLLLLKSRNNISELEVLPGEVALIHLIIVPS